MTDSVLSETRDSICILTLNRPERLNAINRELIKAMTAALIAANRDDNVRVIVLHGGGRAFCTGNDLKETADMLEQSLSRQAVEKHGRELQEVTRLIFNSGKIVIGAIHGWAVGAGFEWAINCDFTVWAEDAQAFFPEVRWGMFATGGVMTLLPKIVGANKAREMLLLGEKYTAAELLELGVAFEVRPEPEVFAAALALAGRINQLPQATVSRFKQTYNRCLFMGLEEVLEAEVAALSESTIEAETQDRVLGFDE